MAIEGDRAAPQSATVSAGNSPGPLIALQEINKSFGGVKALKNVTMEVSRSGVVHSLLGSNGSGKSTLLGILSGQLQPDTGTIRLNGEAVSFKSAADAVGRGIAMVSQENHVARDLSVAENILLGHRLIRSRLGINWAASRQKAVDAMHLLDVDYDPDAPIRTLRADQCQMVEIARAVSMNARILILDEPTSSLTDEEVRALFRVIERLTTEGVSVIFVSHRLPEVVAVADELTILRNGEMVAEGPATEFPTDRIIHAIVGTSRASMSARPARQAVLGDEVLPALEVRGLSLERTLEDVSLEVRAGEIVGLAGLEGTGREELLDAIFGLLPVASGSIVVQQQELHAVTPRRAIDHGIGYVPPDRKSQGVVLSMSVEANLRMAATRSSRRWASPISGTEDLRSINDIAERMRIGAESLQTPVGQLSGGNQQKIVLAKWLLAEPRVLLLAEPTRGVDVGAKAEIHGLLRSLADEGLAILVSSSENDELLEICDRILVMFRGRIVAAVKAEDLNETELARIAAGH